MNENVDLTKILKNCPKGFKLYSTVLGCVSFKEIINSGEYPIGVSCKSGLTERFTAYGKMTIDYDGECTLFPSKDQRDWSKFIAPWYKREKFDPKTLQQFDRVVVKNILDNIWRIQYFSHIDRKCKKYPFICLNDCYTYCIPYNEETKHLVGTKDEAPDFYKYWEK